jgi:hypothetical protein
VTAPKRKGELILRDIVATIAAPLSPGLMLICPVMRAILLPGRVALPPALLNPTSLLLPRAGLILSALRRRLPASYVRLPLMLLGLLNLGVRGALLLPLRLLSTRIGWPLLLLGLTGLCVRRSLLLLLLRLLSTRIGWPLLLLGPLGLRVRRSLLLLRLLSTPVGWPLLLALLPLFGRLLYVVLAALRTAEPACGKENYKSRYCMNTFHRCEPPPETKPEAQLTVTSVSGAKKGS